MQLKRGTREIMHFRIICSRNDRMEGDWLIVSSGKESEGLDKDKKANLTHQCHTVPGKQV